MSRGCRCPLKLCPAHSGVVPLLVPLDPELLDPELLAPPEPLEPELLALPELPLDDAPWRPGAWAPLPQPWPSRSIAASAAIVVEIGVVQLGLFRIVRPLSSGMGPELARRALCPAEDRGGAPPNRVTAAGLASGFVASGGSLAAGSCSTPGRNGSTTRDTSLEGSMRYLPRSYVEAFVDPDARVDGAPAVWVHRAAFGLFQVLPVEPRGGERHFNVPDPGALRHNAELERRLAAVEDEAARLVRERLPDRRPLAPDEREVLATFVAALGIRLSSRFGDLDESEALRGFEELLAAVRGMGWVFWEAEPPFYFVSSSAPFHAAFPKDDGLVQGQALHAPGIELTLPLTPRLALHATWSRRGELWRRAGEAVLLELNARTLQRAHRFVLAPKPAIPL